LNDFEEIREYMSQNTFFVRLEIKDQKVRKELEQIIPSIERFQVQEYSADPKSCDLWILEIGDDLNKEFQVFNSIQAFGTGMEVFLTSPRLEPDLLIQALRAGAKEFFPQPIKKEEVKAALLKFKERKDNIRLSLEKKKRGKIINVIGSKGGVGTTTVAVNLATSLAQSEGSFLVALIDMNFLFGEISIFLDIESSLSWGEIAKNISRLDSTFLMSILSKHSSGVYVLTSPTGLDGVNVVTPEIIEKILSEMQEVFDFILIDAGQSIDETSLKIVKISDIVLLVVALSLPSLTNIKRLLWTFKKLEYPPIENIRVIINRYHKNSEISLKETEKSINKKIFWLVFNDYLTTMSAINRGRTLSSVAPGTEISKNFIALADKFLEKGEKKIERLSIIEKFLSGR
jgi:pilus assembly protein CpaE